MAENDMPHEGDEEDAPPLTIPSHDPLPPPPEIHFTRPDPNRRAGSSPQASLSGGKADLDAGQSGHGAGLAAGFTFVASVLAGLVAGTWLDAHVIHSATPWGTMGMTLAGLGVGFTNLSRLLGRGKRHKP